MPVAKKLEFIRLSWELDGCKGHGDWFEHTPEKAEVLQLYINESNRRRGAGTHRIESNDGGESRDAVQSIIKKMGAKPSSFTP